jgi:hypothetical protein
MAVDGYWATGPALVYTGTGSAGALELLGYTDRGVEVSIDKNYENILTDILGPMTPQELQDFGEVAQITAPLIAVDRTVLNKAMNRGNRGSNGQLNTPGRLVGHNGDSFRVGIAAAADTPWSFSNCVVRPARFGLGVTVKPFSITFFAWPYLAYTATTGLNTPLYTRTLS